MKKVLPLLLSLLLSACGGTFQVNIQIRSEPTQTSTQQTQALQTPAPQATAPSTVTVTSIPAASATSSPAPSRTPTRLPATATSLPSPVYTVSATLPPGPTSTPLPVNIDDPAYPALQPLVAGQVITPTAIQMMDEATGWGIEGGGHLLRTTDGGYTWKNITPPRGRYQPGGLFALNDKIAWATSYSLNLTCLSTPAECPDKLPPVYTAFTWRTDDGGNTWQPSHPFSLGDRDGDTMSVYYYNPVALHFLDAQNGWLLATVNHLTNQDYYRLYRTADGGNTWSWLTDHQYGPLFCATYGIGFRDNHTGWIAGNCVGWGVMDEQHWGVYQTDNGGQSWNWITLTPPNDLPEGFSQYTYDCGVDGVDIIPPDSVGLDMACALHDKASGYSMYHFYFLSPDGGQNWHSWQTTGNVDFLNHETGWRMTANPINGYDLERTVDGGQTWTLLKSVWWNGQLDFVSEQTGWVVARRGESLALLHTTDGGQSWAEIKAVVAR